jgi:hypothetical protein
MSQGTVNVSSQTASAALQINLRKFNRAVGIMVYLTSGASLTYTIQVTADDIRATGYSPATGRWLDWDQATAKTAGVALALPFPVTAIRLNVTTWTSGTATLGLVQADD